MKFKYGKEEYGPGITIALSGAEVANAIETYLVAHGVAIQGARTVTVNRDLCKTGKVYVDPSGFVIYQGKKYSGSKDIKIKKMMFECVGDIK